MNNLEWIKSFLFAPTSTEEKSTDPMTRKRVRHNKNSVEFPSQKGCEVETGPMEHTCPDGKPCEEHDPMTDEALRGKILEALVRTRGRRWTHVTDARRNVLRRALEADVSAVMSVVLTEIDKRVAQATWRCDDCREAHENTAGEIIRAEAELARVREAKAFSDAKCDEYRNELEENFGVMRSMRRQRDAAEDAIERALAVLNSDDEMTGLDDVRKALEEGGSR